MSRYSGRTCRLTLMLVLNFACFLMELTFGMLSKSMVLTADAFNVLSDFLGIVIALVCMKIAARGPSDKNTFGWMRGDVLGALINAVFMIALCVTIVIDSLQRFIQPEPVDQPFVVFIVGFVGLGVNLVGIFVLKDYRSVPKEKEPSALSLEKNAETLRQVSGNSKTGVSSRMNMYGAYLHVLGDALGSVIVIICALIDWKVNVSFLQNYLDPILSILMAIMLTATSISLLKDSSLTLLQAVPTNVNMMNLKSNILAKSHHIMEVKNLHVWQLSSENLVASVRIRFDDALPWEKMINLVTQVENCFYEEGIHVVTVQPEVSDGSVCGDEQSITMNSECCRRRCDTCCHDDQVIQIIPNILLASELQIRSSMHGQSIKSREDVSIWM